MRAMLDAIDFILTNAYIVSSVLLLVGTPTPNFLKINYDGSIKDRGQYDGACFFFHNERSLLVAVGSSLLFDISMPQVELRTV